MMLPTSRMGLCAFIVIVNYYWYMWMKRSNKLQPLTILTYKNVKCIWTDVKQKAFDKVKILVEHNNLLKYPDLK